MSRSTRTALVVVLVGTFLLPALTAHSVSQHLAGLPAGARASGLLHLESLALMGLAALAALPLLRLAIAAMRGWRAARRLATLAAAATDEVLGGVQFTRLPGTRVSLFASGVFTTRIYVTNAAVAQLTPRLLDAGLRHELAHVRLRHVRWLSLLGLLRYAFAPFPGASRCFDAVRLAAERHADDWALADGAPRRDLFDAIATVATATQHAPSVSALGDIGVEQRLRRIAGVAEPAPSLPVWPATLSALGLSSLPLAAHALLWLGLVSGTSWHHTM